jgi:hypothetical protein
MEELILETWQRLGRPGARLVQQALTLEGYKAKEAEVRAVIAKQTETQVFAAPYRSLGRIVAPTKNSRWQVDLIDQTSRNAKANEDFRYALVAVDVWSRRVAGVPMKTKTPDEAIRAINQITGALRGTPQVIETDVGGEWSGRFEAYLQAARVMHIRVSPGHVNGLAVVDNAISRIRRSMGRALVAGREESWVKAFTDAVKALNERPSEHLFGAAPKNADGEKLGYVLDYNAGLVMRDQTTYMRKLEDRLRAAGKFRVAVPVDQRQKSYQPAYSGKVYTLKRIHNDLVEDSQGGLHRLMEVQPVADGDSTVFPQSVRPGNAEQTRQRRQALQPFMEALKAHLGEGSESLQEAGEFLQTIPGYTAAMRANKLDGLRAALLLFDEFETIGAGARTKISVRAG